MKRILMGLAIATTAVSLEARKPAAPAPAADPVRTLVGGLDLENITRRPSRD